MERKIGIVGNGFSKEKIEAIQQKLKDKGIDLEIVNEPEPCKFESPIEMEMDAIQIPNPCYYANDNKSRNQVWAKRNKNRKC